MRQTTRRIALFFCFTFSLAVLSNIAQAQTFTVLHTFTGGDGESPQAPLTVDRAGSLYGTADATANRTDFGAPMCKASFASRRASLSCSGPSYDRHERRSS